MTFPECPEAAAELEKVCLFSIDKLFVWRTPWLIWISNERWLLKISRARDWPSVEEINLSFSFERNSFKLTKNTKRDATIGHESPCHFSVHKAFGAMALLGSVWVKKLRVVFLNTTPRWDWLNVQFSFRCDSPRTRMEYFRLFAPKGFDAYSNCLQTLERDCQSRWHVAREVF